MRKNTLAGIALWCVALSAMAMAETSSTTTGVSRLMNPAVSLNALFLGETSSETGDAEANRIAIQEAEIRFTSVVDPFWTADVVVAWHEEHEEHAEDEHAHTGAPHFATDIEVAQIRSTAMPAGLGLTLGKFYLPFGKHAVLHTHQFPFVRAPIAVQSFLGGHGLTDVGLSVDATVPALPWWSEVTVYGVDGRAEIFNGEHRDLVFGGRWSNLWDVSTNGTLELGGSYLAGPAPGGTGHDRLALLGFDLTYKWVGETVQDPAATITAEVILPDLDDGTDDQYGFYTHAQARMARNWWMGVGVGIARDAEEVVVMVHGEPDPFGFVSWPDYYEYKANVAFAPSEFSALRAEVSYTDSDTAGGDDLRFALQWTFTIGSHPAHTY